MVRGDPGTPSFFVCGGIAQSIVLYHCYNYIKYPLAFSSSSPSAYSVFSVFNRDSSSSKLCSSTATIPEMPSDFISCKGENKQSQNGTGSPVMPSAWHGLTFFRLNEPKFASCQGYDQCLLRREGRADGCSRFGGRDGCRVSRHRAARVNHF